MPFGVEVPDPSVWQGLVGAWLMLLHVLGVVYVALFVAYYVRLRRLERQADRGDGRAVERFNRALHGFPNGFFAKQFGMHPRTPGGGRHHGP